MSFLSLGIGMFKKKVLRRLKENRTLLHTAVAVSISMASTENSPAILCLVINPEEIKSVYQGNIQLYILNTALFTVARKWKSKSPTVSDGSPVQWNSYSAIRQNYIL